MRDFVPHVAWEIHVSVDDSALDDLIGLPGLLRVLRVFPCLGETGVRVEVGFSLDLAIVKRVAAAAEHQHCVHLRTDEVRTPA